MKYLTRRTVRRMETFRDMGGVCLKQVFVERQNMSLPLYRLQAVHRRDTVARIQQHHWFLRFMCDEVHVWLLGLRLNGTSCTFQSSLT